MRPLLNRQPAWVYRIYGEDDRLLYIGMSIHPKVRITEHRYERPHMMREAVSWDAIEFDTRAEALEAESQYIFTHAPAYNIIGQRR